MKRIKHLVSGLSFNLLATVTVALLVMAIITASIGVANYRESLSETYEIVAEVYAEKCAEKLDADTVYSFIEQYRKENDSHPENKETYKEYLDYLQRFCDENRLTFIYIIDVGEYKDNENPYDQFDVIMEVVNTKEQKSVENPDGLTPWALGYNHHASEDNAGLFKKVFEGKESASLPRPKSAKDHGGPHITTTYPLKNGDDEVKALLCLQLSMSILEEGVRQYRVKVAVAAACFVIVAVTLAAAFLRRRFVSPVSKMTAEAQRFAAENSPGQETVVSMVSTKLHEINKLAEAIDTMESETLEYIDSITSMAADKERILTELNVARQIQTGSIPSIFPPFPERKEIELFASMTPAKEVGGDFYDFYFIDENHLVLVMADVSGKGIPAALYMMVTKILISDRAIMGGTPSEILSFVNERLCESNEADMFVTVWLGILDVSSGELVSASAGHEDPFFLSSEGDFELVKEKRGLVVGGMPGVKYHDNMHKLQPGDKLFIYTDGIPEATGAGNVMFGLERLKSSLDSVKESSSEEIILKVKMDVDEFVGEEPQFDDLTMLSLEFNGKKGVEASFDAKLEKLPEVLGFVDSFLDKRGCLMRAKMQIDLSIEELFVNVANYAYPSSEGKVRFRLSESDGKLTIEMSDEGVPFDPFKKPDPDISLGADERPIGGLGVFIVKKKMDSVAYKYENGKNILTITKTIK